METADVVIIGSGYGGSIPAARLAAAGMKVVVLERGGRFTSRDFKQSDDPKYIQRVIDFVVASDNVAFRTGKMVGGASIPMDGAHYRAPQFTFDTQDSSGRPYWPDGYSRAALDPYYQLAEDMIGVRQFAWNEISKAGGLFAKMLDLYGASCDRARLNYTDCVHCGYCAQGCIFGKKNNLTKNYVPFAEKNGAEFRSDCLALDIGPSGTGHVVAYQQLKEVRQIWGQRVIVACGGIHSPALLLRSKKNLPNMSTHVGENFNNNGEHSFVGIVPDRFNGWDLSDYNCFKGSDNAAVMSFHFLESDRFTLHPGGGLEPSIFASFFEQTAGQASTVLPQRAWGMDYKRFAEKVYPHHLIAFSALGLADGHRAVVIGADGNVDVAPRDRTAYDAYLDHLESKVFDIGAKTGVTLISAVPRKLAGITSAHLLCANRMADTIDNGVVDSNCQVFGYENLYVTDASAMPYALGVNPALTISAVAERAAAGIIARG